MLKVEDEVGVGVGVEARLVSSGSDYEVRVIVREIERGSARDVRDSELGVKIKQRTIKMQLIVGRDNISSVHMAMT